MAKDLKKLKSALAAAKTMRKDLVDNLAPIDDLIAGLEEAISETGTATDKSSMLSGQGISMLYDDISEDDNY